MKRTTMAGIAGIGILGCAIATACGDDDDGSGASSSSGGLDGGASSSSSSSGSATSSGGSSSHDGGDAARGPNVGTWHYEDASAVPAYDWVGVWGHAADSVYAAGRNPGNAVGGGIWRWSPGDGGLAWRSVYGNAQEHWSDISGVAPTDVWAVGYTVSPAGSPVSVGFDGGVWGVRGPGPGFVEHLWGAGPGDYWATTSNIGSKLLHFTGGAWSEVTIPGATSVTFVTGAGGNVYALGSNIVDAAFEWSAYVLANGTWTGHVIGTSPTVQPLAMWASGPNDVFVVGESGVIMHWDGAAFTKQDSTVTQRLYAVWGFYPDDVFAVGAHVALHYDGKTWTSEPIPPGDPVFLDMWGAAPGDVWAVGQSGVMLHRTATK